MSDHKSTPSTIVERKSQPRPKGIALPKKLPSPPPKVTK